MFGLAILPFAWVVEYQDVCFTRKGIRLKQMVT